MRRIGGTSGFRWRVLDLLRFRGGPQDMPAGWPTAVLMTALYLAQAVVADRLLDQAEQAPRSMVAVTIQFLATALILRVKRLASRLPQTLTALAAAGFVFGLASILLVLQARPGEAQPLLVLVWIGTFLWSLAVDGHIYRHALSIKISMGMLVAVVIFAINFVVIEALFPTPG